MNKLKSKNLIYSFFLIQIIIYSFVIPLFRYFKNSEKFEYYPYIIIEIIILFLPFFVFSNFYFYSNYKLPRQKITFYVENNIAKRAIGFLFYLLVFCLPFYFIQISLDYNILYRRIGNEYLSEIYTTIPFYKKIIIKLYTQFQSFWFGSLMYLFYLTSLINKKSSILLNILIIINFIFIILYDLINSRLDLIVYIVTLLILGTYFSKKKFKILSLKYIVSILCMLYFVFIVINLRKTVFAGQEFELKQLSPIEVFKNTDHSDIENDFINRLDGIEIINKTFVNLNYGLTGDINLLLNNAIIFFLPNSNFASEKRYKSETTIKVEMLNKYGNTYEKDYNSSMLTDLFGVFGVFGYLFGGILLGFLISKLDFLLSNMLYYKTYVILFCLFFYSVIVSFEMSFWNIVFTPLRFMPFFILFCFVFNRLLNFFKIKQTLT